MKKRTNFSHVDYKSKIMYLGRPKQCRFVPNTHARILCVPGLGHDVRYAAHTLGWKHRLRSSVLLVLLQRTGIRCARFALGLCHSNDNVVTGMRETMFSHVLVFRSTLLL